MESLRMLGIFRSEPIKVKGKRNKFEEITYNIEIRTPGDIKMITEYFDEKGQKFNDRCIVHIYDDSFTYIVKENFEELTEKVFKNGRAKIGFGAERAETKGNSAKSGAIKKVDKISRKEKT